MRNLVFVVSCLAACSHSSRPQVAEHPKGYAEHMAAASEHAQKAEDHRKAGHVPDSALVSGSGYQCGDVVMSDQSTSGGERLVQSTPCWDTNEELASHNKALAEREERAARKERRAAVSMAEAEDAACRGLSASDLEHSPFAHKRAIAEVIPHADGGRVHGVRVIFKPVPGLSAAWMRQAIACHRARFDRLGQPAAYMPDDPTLVATAKTEVVMNRGHIEVVVEVRDEVQAAVSKERAEDLVRERTASR